MGIRRAAVGAAWTVLALSSAAPAMADFKVDTPVLEQGAVVFEHSASRSRDGSDELDRETSIVHSVAFGVSEHWQTEVGSELFRAPGADEELGFEVLKWKNTFRFTPAEDDRPFDLGGVVEYARSVTGGPDEIQAGGLLLARLGPTTQTLNLLFGHELGENAGDGVSFGYAAQSRWEIDPGFAVALEAFGDAGRIGRFASVSEQEHRLGPVVSGAFDLGAFGTVGYELGYLFGLTSGTPDGTIKWLLAYQITF